MSFPAPTGVSGNNPFGLQVTLTWPPVTVPDPDNSLLLYMNGSNGSTTFIDSSANNFTVTNIGSSTQSNAQAPSFEITAGAFSGGIQYLTVPIVANGPLDLSSGQGDFTLEGWMYFQNQDGSLGGGIGSFIQTSGSGNSPGGNEISCNATSLDIQGGGIFTGIGGAVPGKNIWVNFAFVRSGLTLGLFINGVLATSKAAALGENTTGHWVFGAAVSNEPYTGYLSNIRITKGLARYTSNYTVIGPLPNSTPSPGYDIYRGGISVGTVLGSSAFTDTTVPSPGTYLYTVACWDGSVDVSPQSSPATPVVVIGGGGGGGGGPGAPGGGGLINWVGNTGTLTAKFVPPTISKAIMLANPGTINPRAYVPEEDTTARLPLPRLPL